ncbi:hypothetical protein C9374_005670 [Naegleria lovaniensis]|uniref:Gamma-soluble NSF attachment protein n=1 Tax=Naegleria lovaniensis TaxID=51637 RepID=A0AA88GNW8_NAELO|nr:uncharacterized protein C9374_005670 [Naegleria lovaniensis]KAG2381878.1 hypothetical protein C9374_005670 [Naegleria lovaniensis]
MSNPNGIYDCFHSSASKSLMNFFKPDYDSAAAAFEKAALIYKQLKLPAKAIQCYSQCGECFGKCGIYYKSGSAFENAAALCKDLKEFDKASELYSKAFQMYVDDGKGNRAGEALVKGAKVMAESGAIAQAVELYKTALESISTSGYHNAMNTFRSFNSFLLQNSLFEEAIQNALEMMKGYKDLNQKDGVCKSCTTIILICLAMDDYVRAEEFQKRFSNEESDYLSSPEYDISNDFLEAFERMDQNLLENAKTNNQLKYLEREVYKMASKMKITSNLATLGASSTRSANRVNEKKNMLLADEIIEEDDEDISKDMDRLIVNNNSDNENDDPFDPDDLT